MRGHTIAATTLVIVLGLTSIAHGQAGSTMPGQDRSAFPPISGRERDETTAKMEQQQARSRNSDRQKRLLDDTNKLLSLATELKSEVDKTDKNTLSLDVIKKADEIEKLAHSVKERMKG